MSFAENFRFSRPSAAPYTDAAGVRRIAAVNVPRFDHAGCRCPRGLLVEQGGALGQEDLAQLRARDWSAAKTWTILHGWEDANGIRQDAHYADDPAAMIDGVLEEPGWHRRIAAVPGYLPNYGGWVWALGQRWNLPDIIATDGEAIALGTRVLVAR